MRVSRRPQGARIKDIDRDERSRLDCCLVWTWVVTQRSGAAEMSRAGDAWFVPVMAVAISGINSSGQVAPG